MVTQIQLDAKIPLKIHELAATHNVGTPLIKHKKRIALFFLVIITIAALACTAWELYFIYAYVAFIVLLHTYPNMQTVPIDQFSNYYWLQTLHNTSWIEILRNFFLLLQVQALFLRLYPVYKINLYICTDGLLKIEGRQTTAIRWDEIQEIYTTTDNVISRLVKNELTSFELPEALMFNSKKTTSSIIKEEVIYRLLPPLLARYERGETLKFGKLEVNQTGIYHTGSMIKWERLGGITLEADKLSVYSREMDRSYRKKPVDLDKEEDSTRYTEKWRVWQKKPQNNRTPNMVLFVALVGHILDKKNTAVLSENTLSQTDLASPQLTLSEAAILATFKARKRKRRRTIAMVASVLSIVVIFTSFITYTIINDQAIAAHDQIIAARNQQQLLTTINTLAHKSYYAHAPGTGCDHSKGYWYNEDTKNSVMCLSDGMYMVQEDMKYQDLMYFTFDPTDQTNYTGKYMPHHYRIEVQAHIIISDYGTCVGLVDHIQNFAGSQTFLVCLDGYWYYRRCNLNCTDDKQVAYGSFPRPDTKLQIALDVTDTTQTLFVNNVQITKIYDKTYSTTDEVALSFTGSSYANTSMEAVFSDFRYTPYP